ncbi:MAG: hypothetical protein FP816_03895 [Desulfobacteraceae bacterium]|nr:hypothetical protein [Desulfobacteraceae bacterium]MBU4001359.1 hypothetical protein [Pseudomonadota bacterium]MBU4054794.1 hypothetical protein [Pseudomonadota bacterium]
MAARKISTALIMIGLCLIAYYFIVRLAFIQDINAALAKAQVFSLSSAFKAMVPAFYAYILFGYSFKLGMLLILIGGALKAGMESNGIRFLISGGILYMAVCYVPIGYFPLFFGIQGTTIVFLFFFILWNWVKKRPHLDQTHRIAHDFRMIGYYFFIVATWTLCGIFGISAYALKPELMIKHGLQSNAVTLTSHVMIELLLGWIFIALSIYKEKSSNSV